MSGLVSSQGITSQGGADDTVYGASWNSSLKGATKNAIYDKIETLGAGGGDLTVVSIDNTDSPYTVTATDGMIEVDASAGDVNITLPAVASSAGKELTFVRTDDTQANLITISGDANISGQSNKLMSVKAYPETGFGILYAGVGLNATAFFGECESAKNVVAIWVLASGGSQSMDIFSAVPNTTNWDVTRVHTSGTLDFEELRWQRILLPSTMVLAQGDLFGAQFNGTGPAVKIGTQGFSMPNRFYNSPLNGGETNINISDSGTAGYAVIAEVESATAYDIAKLIGGSTQWIETIA